MDGYNHDTRHGENDGDVEIYVGIIMQKIFLTFEFFCTTVQKISFGVQKKTIDLEFVVHKMSRKTPHSREITRRSS